MVKTNPLREMVFKEGGGGDLFVNDFPAKLRVLSTDPLAYVDRYANTKFAFPVWSYDQGKPMILAKGASIAKPIQVIDMDADFGEDVTTVDLKITKSGEGKETRYTVNVLRKAEKLTDDQLEEAAKLDGSLEKVFPNGIRVSELNTGKELPQPDTIPGDEDLDGPPPSDDDYPG
jgi:hypothetical protein